MSAAYPKFPHLSHDEAVRVCREERAKRAERFYAERQARLLAVNARIAADEARQRAQVLHAKATGHTRRARVPIANVMFPMGVAAQLAREAKAAPRARREA